MRNLESPSHLVLQIIIGSAPNFFAGITLVLWIKYVTGRSFIRVFIASFMVLVIGEVIQTLMKNQTADWYDVIASLIGCGIGVTIALFIDATRSHEKEHS